jgi:hypothetical protein
MLSDARIPERVEAHIRIYQKIEWCRLPGPANARMKIRAGAEGVMSNDATDADDDAPSRNQGERLQERLSDRATGGTFC